MLEGPSDLTVTESPLPTYREAKQQAAFELRVERLETVSDRVRLIELTHPDGHALPPWQPMDVIEVLIEPTLIRSFALCGDPADRHRWRLLLSRVPEGRGGSRMLWAILSPGRRLKVLAPVAHPGMGLADRPSCGVSFSSPSPVPEQSSSEAAAAAMDACLQHPEPGNARPARDAQAPSPSAAHAQAHGRDHDLGWLAQGAGFAQVAAWLGQYHRRGLAAPAGAWSAGKTAPFDAAALGPDDASRQRVMAWLAGCDVASFAPWLDAAPIPCRVDEIAGDRRAQSSSALAWPSRLLLCGSPDWMDSQVLRCQPSQAANPTTQPGESVSTPVSGGVADTMADPESSSSGEPHRLSWVPPAAAPADRARVICHLPQGSMQVLAYRAGDNLLDTLRDAGILLQQQCRQGVCGACVLKVLQGRIAHGDRLITDLDRLRGDVLLACRSGPAHTEIQVTPP